MFSNGLIPAESERIAILAEEMGEAIQAISKVLCHGYESYNPVIDTGMTNRRELEKELGHVICIMKMMSEEYSDVSASGIHLSAKEKREKIKRWLHHQ
jgi:NTP pyrophosphatase (non-canonical NTP hydrolase)